MREKEAERGGWEGRHQSWANKGQTSLRDKIQPSRLHPPLGPSVHPFCFSKIQPSCAFSFEVKVIVTVSEPTTSRGRPAEDLEVGLTPIVRAPATPACHIPTAGIWTALIHILKAAARHNCTNLSWKARYRIYHYPPHRWKLQGGATC